jgi:hypothetical protein
LQSTSLALIGSLQEHRVMHLTLSLINTTTYLPASVISECVVNLQQYLKKQASLALYKIRASSTCQTEIQEYIMMFGASPAALLSCANRMLHTTQVL